MTRIDHEGRQEVRAAQRTRMRCEQCGRRLEFGQVEVHRKKNPGHNVFIHLPEREKRAR